VALPVISTAVLIAAGCANQRTLVGRVLALRPMQWIGARSYSLYLWHWPFLIIAAEYLGDDLSATQNAGLILLAVAATAITYRLVENPVRHARFLAGRPGLTLAIGAVLMIVTVGIAQWQIATAPRVSQRHEDAPLAGGPYATTAQVLAAVKAAEQVQTVPDTVAASLPQNDYSAATGCFDRLDTQKPAELEKHPPAGWPIAFGECAYGDRAGTKLMVMFGDSRADTFAAPLEGIAAKAGWKLRVFAMGGCEVSDLEHWSYVEKAPNKACDTFRSAAISQIRKLHPNLVITTSAGNFLLADGTLPTPAQEQDAWLSTFQKLAQPGTRLAMIGPIPQWPNNDERCLAAHIRKVQACSIATTDLETPKYEAPQAAAAAAAGVVFVSPRAWVCADRCEPVIADIRVYNAAYHFSLTYAVYLTGALSEALQPAMA
jgi:hypothetical protein